MNIYSVRKGGHYFSGNKIQTSTFQYIIFLVCFVLGIVFNSSYFFIIAAVSFLGFHMYLKNNIISDSVRIYFFQNCTYQLSQNYDQINKAYGFSKGFHLWNSARIGWRCVNGEDIELLAYCYVNGKRIVKPLIKCKPESWVFCNIQDKSSKYVFKALSPNNQSIIVSIDKGKKFSFYALFNIFIYKLFPYFGGKIPAPHNMDLYIIKLHIE